MMECVKKKVNVVGYLVFLFVCLFVYKYTHTQTNWCLNNVNIIAQKKSKDIVFLIDLKKPRKWF